MLYNVHGYVHIALAISVSVNMAYIAQCSSLECVNKQKPFSNERITAKIIRSFGEKKWKLNQTLHQHEMGPFKEKKKKASHFYVFI